MPTYELPKDKRLDYYLAVPKALLPKFLSKLEKISNSALNDLMNNPNGKSPYTDSTCPLPNMTFEYDDYQYFIRRDSSPNDFDNFQKVWDSLQNEGYEGTPLFALELYHLPYYSHINEISGDEGLNGNILEITYMTDCNLETGECDCEINDPDFSAFPPDTTSDLVESLFEVRKPGDKQVAGTIFGYFAFSMEASVAEKLRETLPEDMLEYLEKMNSTHAVFHDSEEENLNCCELYLLYNVPLYDYNHDFFTAEYEDKNVVMGARFYDFLDKNNDDLEESGEFAICISPQPGILQIQKGKLKMFSTPWKIVDYLCVDNNEEANILFGNEEYYTDEPFHLQIQRFINISPKVLEEARFNSVENIDFINDANTEKQNDSLLASHKAGDNGQKAFENFLIEQGYSTQTPTGKPSTVFDYIKRVERVCKEEGLQWSSLPEHINKLVTEYDKDGIKAEQGTASHSAVINALKAFQKFVKNCPSIEEVPEEKTEDSVSVSGADHQKGVMVDPNEAIQDDYIICCVCGEKRQSITAKHLASHGLSIEDYKQLCGYNPDKPLLPLNKLKQSRQIMNEFDTSSK